MKSVYIVFPQKEQICVETEDVAPPASGEVLCRALCSLVSIGTERICLQGVVDPGTNWAAWIQYPFRPGYSMVARVVEVGSDVKGWRAGDRVITQAPHQQFFKSLPEHLVPIPSGISDEDATWTTLATTAQLAVRRAQHELGERVAVIGLGPLGQLVVQYLAIAGCSQIIAIDRNPTRLRMARAHGATNSIGADVSETRAGIELLTGGKMLDVVYEVTGNPQVLAHATELLRPMGRLILLGDTPTPSRQYLGASVISNSLSILGLHSSARPMQGTLFQPWGAKEMMNLFFDYLKQGRLRVADLITHHASPLDAPLIYEMLLRDRSGAIGVVFDWTLPGAEN